MPGKHELSSKHIESVLRGRTVEDIVRQMQPDTTSLPNKIPVSAKTTLSRVEKTWQLLDRPDLKETLLAPDVLPSYQGNIENLIGTLKIPVGIAGPLRVNGFFAKGDYPVPLATTEAALVASYHRGANLITESGGCSTMVLVESVTRSPSFAFPTVADAGQFALWALSNFETLQKVALTTTSHGQLNDVGTIEGNHVYLNFDFNTATPWYPHELSQTPCFTAFPPEANSCYEPACRRRVFLSIASRRTRKIT